MERAILAGCAVAALVLAVGCRSAPAPVPRLPPPSPAPVSAPVPGPVLGRAPAPVSPAVGRIIASARSLLGVPYRHGGADSRGFDCSGLVSYVFAAAGLALPRRAADQAETGRWVALDEVSAGDLLFFSTAAKPNHLGVVVSASGGSLRMIHASTSRGVIETDVLHEPYWLGRLKFGRRVLPGG